MKGTLTILMLAFVLTGSIIYSHIKAPDEQKTYQLSDLAKNGEECELISEKAALQLPEVLEFQRLEKAGRKARVLEICMNDHGYQENPAWALFAKQLAEQEASKLSAVSRDEAYETLRRKYMLIYLTERSEPLYWIKSTPTQH